MLPDLPDPARARLAQSRRGLFTSDLSVNEFVLVGEAGFVPLGLVMGSSAIQVGRGAPVGYDGVPNLGSAAYDEAGVNAVRRLQEEAEALDADGVVSVRLDVRRGVQVADAIEFIAIGTAIRHRDGVVHRAPDGRPFTSHLTGQAFWTLMRAGHRPVGLVMGACVLPTRTTVPAWELGRPGRDVALSGYARQMTDAREYVLRRMRQAAAALGADGIVGMQQTETARGTQGVVEFLGLATAVVRCPATVDGGGSQTVVSYR